MPAPGMPEGRRGQRGIALVAVLWVLVALAMMAAGTLRTGRLETDLARNSAGNARAAALAEAGVHRAIAGLLDPAPGFTWQPDATYRSFAFAGGTVRVRIEAEGGKVDLNEAPEELLAAVMEAGGAPPDAARALAGAVADFRDADQLVRPGGAGGGGIGGERADYGRLGLAGPRDAPFEAVEELMQVAGMTRRLFERVAPLVTVDSGRPTVYRSLAPRAVLLILPGMDAATADAIVEARSRGMQPLPRGSVVSILAEGHAAAGAVAAREAVVELGDDPANPYRILRWRDVPSSYASGH